MDSNNINISKDVLATIVTVASNEVDGVEGIVSNLSTNVTSLIKKKKIAISGICINVNEENNSVDLDVSIVIKFGYELKPVCEKVQTKIKDAIENMTNLVVSSVNVTVGNIKEGALKEQL